MGGRQCWKKVGLIMMLTMRNNPSLNKVGTMAIFDNENEIYFSIVS